MLLPFALMAAVDRINNMHVDINGLTTEMKFPQVAGSTGRLQNYHTFDCPVYVLDARLQDAGGAGPPKWDPHTHLACGPFVSTRWKCCTSSQSKNGASIASIP